MKSSRQLSWGWFSYGVLLMLLMANVGVAEESKPSASGLECTASPVEKPSDVLTLDSTTSKWLLKTPPSKYLVDNKYYALCLSFSARTKPVILNNTFGFPVLIDGLKIALPATASAAHPALTITGSSPVLVRNSTITGNDGAGSTGIAIQDNDTTLNNVQVSKVTQGITVSGQQMVTLIGSTTITGTLNKGQTGLQINGDNVVMQGGKILNFTTGVVLGGKGNTISGTTITRDAPAENTIGITLQGTDLFVQDATIAQMATGIVITPNTNLTVTGGSITDANVGVHVLAPAVAGTAGTAALADPAAPAVETSAPSMTLLPGKFVKVTTPFKSEQPLPEDLTKNLMMAKLCAKTVASGEYEICDTADAENTVGLVEGMLPVSYCETPPKQPLDVVLYGYITPNLASDVDADQLILLGQCTLSALSKPQIFIAADKSATQLSVGSCVFSCEKDSEGKSLATQLKTYVRPIGFQNSAVDFLTTSALLALYDISWKITTASPLSTMPAPIVVGAMGGPGDTGDGGVAIVGGGDSIGDSGSTLVASGTDFGSGGPVSAPPASDPGAPPADAESKPSGGTVAAATGGDMGGSVMATGSGLGSSMGGCSLIIRQ